jgi:hypothetical protein
VAHGRYAVTVNAFLLVVGHDRVGKRVGGKRAGHEDCQLGGLGRREVEDPHPYRRFLVDEVDMPEFAFDHKGLARVLERSKSEGVWIHHIDRRVGDIDGGGGKGHDLEGAHRVEQTLRILAFDHPGNGGLGPAAEDRELRPHVDVVAVKRVLDALGGEREVDLEDRYVRAVLGVHTSGSGGVSIKVGGARPKPTFAGG